MTFDDTGSAPEQEFEMHPDPTGVLQYSTKYVYSVGSSSMSKGLQVKRSPVKRSTKIHKYIYTHKININERIIIQKFISVKDLEKLEKKTNIRSQYY